MFVPLYATVVTLDKLTKVLIEVSAVSNFSPCLPSMHQLQAPGQRGPPALAVGIEMIATRGDGGTGSLLLDVPSLRVETTGDDPSLRPEGGPSVHLAAADESLRVAGTLQALIHCHDAVYNCEGAEGP